MTAEQARQYLGVLKTMGSPKLLLLVVPPNPKCEEVEFYRRLANDILNCKAGECAEVSL